MPILYKRSAVHSDAVDQCIHQQLILSTSGVSILSRECTVKHMSTGTSQAQSTYWLTCLRVLPHVDCSGEESRINERSSNATDAIVHATVTC